MRRIVNRNRDLIASEYRAEPSSEQYSLFRDYLDARHRKGGMSDMTVLDYAMMIEDSHVETRIIEYRLADIDSRITGKSDGPLVAVALSDVMGDGMSMVYSFFDPDLADRSLGTFMILDHIERTRKTRPAACLSRLLGQRLAQDGLQDQVPAPGASRRARLGAVRSKGRYGLTPEPFPTGRLARLKPGELKGGKRQRACRPSRAGNPPPRIARPEGGRADPREGAVEWRHAPHARQ
jgi:hypothetical protein